jgi:hypothetical protein
MMSGERGSLVPFEVNILQSTNMAEETIKSI